MNIGVYKTLTRNLKLAIEKRVPIITLLFFWGGGGGWAWFSRIFT